MAAIKPIDQSSEKWVRRASVATPEYTAGIESPRESWSAAAGKAEPNFKAGVIAAANAGRYGKGVKRSGDDRWRKMALQKGPGRYTEGVAVGREDWASGFTPYQAAIAGVTLPARGPRRSIQNLDRVRIIATTLGSLYEKTKAV